MVVATESHMLGLEAELAVQGVDFGAARSEGRYVTLDAVELLSYFVGDDGMPHPELFAAVVGDSVAAMAERWPRLRIYGEMVALLWLEGQTEAVLRLEDLWNGLGTALTFSLLCGYPVADAGGEVANGDLAAICASHTHVLR
jgi:hypothetical protein